MESLACWCLRLCYWVLYYRFWRLQFLTRQNAKKGRRVILHAEILRSIRTHTKIYVWNQQYNLVTFSSSIGLLHFFTSNFPGRNPSAKSIPRYSEPRWLGRFKIHDQVSKHECNFFTVGKLIPFFSSPRAEAQPTPGSFRSVLAPSRSSQSKSGPSAWRVKKPRISGSPDFEDYRRSQNGS